MPDAVDPVGKSASDSSYSEGQSHRSSVSGDKETKPSSQGLDFAGFPVSNMRLT